MMQLETRRWLRGVIFMIVTALLLPLSLPAASAGAQPPRTVPKQGMSTKKKLVLLAGAGLLYYLYKKHQATRARAPVNGDMTTRVRQPQLYRSKNGGIYYRDAQGQPVWLTVPQQRVELPLEEVRRYAPDYARYRGPAPAAPRGYRTESFSDFNGGLLPGPSRN
jgi:hypothetical protein